MDVHGCSLDDHIGLDLNKEGEYFDIDSNDTQIYRNITEDYCHVS